VARQRCLNWRLLQLTHPSEETLMIDLEMTLVIKTKKVGPWIHMNLRGAMFWALDQNYWPHPTDGGSRIFC
jgi:hypothetical protein